MRGDKTGQTDLPNWVPVEARHYLCHTEQGQSIRALARDTGVHASTILRQVRRMEQKRDDPLIDEGLRRLGRAHFAPARRLAAKESTSVKLNVIDIPEAPSETTIAKEGRRILRRLCENGAVLAVAKEMDKAVVVRDAPDGSSTKTAVVDRDVAQAMALKNWINCNDPDQRIMRYRITCTGRTALKELLAEAENRAVNAAKGFADAQTGFRGLNARAEAVDTNRTRFTLAESPLATLARRKDRDGAAFLIETQVVAGERLREDFELAQMASVPAPVWEQILSGGQAETAVEETEKGPEAARQRVERALADLGPGLGHVVLRCCCFLDGLEATEKRMGWSARSGKVVLRIALGQLHRHYQALYGRHGPMIG